MRVDISFSVRTKIDTVSANQASAIFFGTRIVSARANCMVNMPFSENTFGR